MKNIKKEKALKFSQEIIDNLPCNMEELLEIKLNEITTEKNVVFENFLKEKKSLWEIKNHLTILITLLSVVFTTISSISTISYIFNNNFYGAIFSVLATTGILIYFIRSFSNKTLFGRFFANIDIKLNKKEEMQKIVNNLPVDKNILSIFKTVYGGDKLKNLMMQNDVVTYENVKKTIQEIKTEKDFQNIIKEKIEKEKKIDEIVSSL